MMGDVVASPDEALVGHVRGLAQVLDFLKDIKKVFIPPIPRFVSEDAVPLSTMHLTHQHRTTR